MPSKKQYNLVSDDAYDSRIPLYNEEAFQHGIHFHAKYIGSLDVPRPSSRVEIVAAMRRIRYEFKAKSMKKKKVTITVCVDGVKVVLRSKRKSNAWPWDENKFILLHHPIYRIFYVSHDSQDLKIFSYIARDGGTNAFKCNVFKSKKKSQAMRIVRTIGQAFEVCHKLSMALASSSASGGPSDETDDNTLQDNHTKGKCQGDGASEPNSCDTQEETIGPKFLDTPSTTSPQHSNGNNLNMVDTSEPTTKTSLVKTSNFPESSSVYHHIQLLKEQLEQQSQQMQSVAGQVQLLKDQLAAETTARLEAQSQNHHLLAHNRELLEHIKKLVNHVHEIEEKYHKADKFDTTLPEPFLSGTAYNSNSYTSNSKFLQHSSPSTSAKFSADLDHTPSEPLFPRTYPSPLGRQLSVPSPGGRNSSPKFGVTFNHGESSLPGYFDSTTSGFACSSPKLPRKGRSAGQIPDEVDRSPPTFPPSSASPGYRQRSTFDFDGSVPSSPFRPKKSSVFEFDPPPQNSFNHREFESDFCPSIANGARESFIAQVTRDLAKMSTGSDRHLSDSAFNKSYPDSGFSSVFKS